MEDSKKKETGIIIFDGNCNFCSRWVLWAIKHDIKDAFRFTASQTDAGVKLLQELHLENISDKSFILVEDEKIFTRSDAALRVAKKLNGIIPLLYVFIILPAFIRNFFYDYISKNRYKWFGKRDSCFLPDEKIKSKFL